MSRFMSLYPSAQRSKAENKPQLPSHRQFRPRFQGDFAPAPMIPRTPRPHTPFLGLPPTPRPQYDSRHLSRPPPHTYTRSYDPDTSYETSYADTSQADYTEGNSSSHTTGAVTGYMGYEQQQTEDQEYAQPETVVAEKAVFDYSHGNAGAHQTQSTGLYGNQTQRQSAGLYGNQTQSTGLYGNQTQSTRLYGRARGYGFPRVLRAQAHSNRGRGDYPATFNQQHEAWQEDSSYSDNTQMGYDKHTFPGARGRAALIQPRGFPPRGMNPYVHHAPNRGRGRGADNISNQTLVPPDHADTENSPLVDSVDEVMEAIAAPISQKKTPSEEVSINVRQSPTSTASVVSTSTIVSTSQTPSVPVSSPAVVHRTSQQSTHISSASPSASQTASSSSGISTSQSSAISSNQTNKPIDSLVPTRSQPQSTSQNVTLTGLQTGTTSITSVSDTVTSSSSVSQTVPDTTTMHTSKVKTSNDISTSENSQSKLISSFAQSLMNNAGSPQSKVHSGPVYPSQSIRPPVPPLQQMTPFSRLPGPTRPQMSPYRRPPGPTPPPTNPLGTSPYRQQGFQSPSSHSAHSSPMPQGPHYTQSPVREGTVDSTTYSIQKGDNPEEEDEESEEEIDTGHCQYCNIDFSNPDSYWKHTRGILHTQRLMEAESKKKEEGEYFFKTETVDAGPKFVKRDEKGKRVLSTEERRQTIRDEIKMVTMIEESGAGDGHEYDEYDFNRCNWMDMEEGQKSKIPARDRDLNPNDVGKEQFPDEFYCEVCDVRCTGSVTFKMHVEGNKHKIKIEKGGKKGNASGNVKIVPCDKPAKIHQTFNNIHEPLVGLQYVTEFQKQDEKLAPKYVCNMCEAKCDGNSIISHCSGIKHRNHYFKEHYPETYQKMMAYTSRKKSEQNTFAEEFARDVESKEGRQSVKVKLEIDVSTELAAADLIKSGALDHLLEGTAFTRENLEKLDVERLKPPEQESEGKVKIQPVIQPLEERTSLERLLPTKIERESMLKSRGSEEYQGRKEDKCVSEDRLLPVGRSEDRLLPGRRSEDRLLQERRSDDRLLPERRPEDRLLPERRSEDRLTSRLYPDDRLPPERHLRRPEDEYLRRPLGRGLYDDPYYRRRGIPLDDPYYRRYPDSAYRLPTSSDEVKIKPVVIMDYAHSNSPKEEIRLGLTEEERAFMKRKIDGPKTDEELFHEFLKWKKTKRVPIEPEPVKQETVTSDNYQVQISQAAPPVPPMGMQQQPMDLPSYTSSSQSTSKKDNKNITPAATVQPPPAPEEVPQQVQELMSSLSKSMIHTEDEAAMALQVSNALTQALLEYQLKSISKELQDTVQQQQQALAKIQQPTGKAETKKLKKQRFDAYSMFDGKTKTAVTSSKAIVTSTKPSVSNTHAQSLKNVTKSHSKQQISAQSVQKSQTVSSAQNVVMSNLSNYQQPQGVMTSSQYVVPQTFASAQQMMMTSQNMMSSSQYAMPQTSVTPAQMMSSQQVMTSQPGAGIQGNAGYQYQQFQNAYSYPQVSQGTNGNVVQGVPPPLGWNSMYVNQPMAPPLPPDNQFMPQPPLPPEEYPKPPPPPE